VVLEAGVKAPNSPVQNKIDSPLDKQFGDYTIKGLATINVIAKVLAKKNYSFDRCAGLSPTDATLKMVLVNLFW
jgi:hypothetical protein